jgi:hypothetical protein
LAAVVDRIRNGWSKLGASWRLACTVAFLLFVTMLLGAVWAQTTGGDGDGDGMSDAYETLFGLDPSNPADAVLDNDADALANLDESTRRTDPFLADTDMDGWNDALDEDPLSRAVVFWGTPRFTSGDDYASTGPAWFLAAWRSGGDWVSADPSWHVPTNAPAGTGALVMEVDRALLTNDAAVAIDLLDTTGASLYMDLLNASGTPVAADLFGNLLSGQGGERVLTKTVPFGVNPGAAAIRLRRGYGDIRVYATVLYVDRDMDGLDAAQEAQLGTSDFDADSDDDGFSDWDEVMIHATDPMSAASTPRKADPRLGGGEAHCALVLPDGRVLTWGNNADGQLGIGTTGGSSAFATNVVLRADGLPLADIAGLGVGDYHVLARSRAGAVWSWGRGGYGRLGDGQTTDRSRAVRVHGVAGVGLLTVLSTR